MFLNSANLIESQLLIGSTLLIPLCQLALRSEPLAGLGVTDLNAVPCAVEGDPNVVRRTLDLLADLARASV